MTSPTVSVIIPGSYSASAAAWGSAYALGLPAQYAAIGFNTVDLDPVYEPTSFSANPPTTASVTDANFTAMVTACKNAGLAICLKPHIVPTVGASLDYCPGATIGTSASYTGGQNTITSTAWNWSGPYNNTNPLVGSRIVIPNFAHQGDIPNTNLSNYGTTTPTWNTVTSVLSATKLQMSNNAAISGVQTAYVLNDTAAATFFPVWEGIIEHLLDLCNAAGAPATSINIGAELDSFTPYYDSDWRSLISAIRAYQTSPVLTLWLHHAYGMNNPNLCSFWDALDYISMSAYPTVDPDQTSSLSVMETGWKNAIGTGTPIPNASTTAPGTWSFASMSSTWSNKPINYGELGALSIVGCGYFPGGQGTNAIRVGLGGGVGGTITAGSNQIPCNTLPSLTGTGYSTYVGLFVSVLRPNTTTASGVYIPANTHITGVSGNTLTVSNNCTGSGSLGVAINITATAASQTDQATFLTAAITESEGQSWWEGFHWYDGYYLNNSVASQVYEDSGTDFSIKGGSSSPVSGAQAVIKSFYTPEVPGVPTIGIATPGNAQVSVTFSPPSYDGNSPITGYIIYPSPGSPVSVPASPGVVTGLTNGTSYKFTVAAVNAIGTGPPSASSNSAIPTAPALPGPPTGVSASAGDAQATVFFTAPGSTGGQPILYYTITSSLGDIASGSGSPIVLGGLTNGTSYTFTVTATTSVGTGPSSTPSNAATPEGPITYSTFRLLEFSNAHYRAI